MSRAANMALIFVVWAAIYLPWLGTPELRSEEGRRVLPAVSMIDSGDYLVPHLGGVPFLRKPPLINWIVAASFRFFGTRNEWTARLPSAISVLVAAQVFLLLGRRVLGDAGARIAALAWLTNLGLMEKGRMIEIDALYVSLFSIAFVCWIALWQRNRSPWITWILPWFFLGIGLLAKGPAHLVFFYPLIIAVLWRNGRLRDLLHPAHFVGIALMAAMFAAWAVPCFAAVHTDSISATWRRELVMRITGGENDATNWPMNFPHGIGYFLPWLFLLPFVRPAKMENAVQQKIAAGLFWGAVLPFVITLLLPGTIPRYILPIMAPACWLIGMAVRDCAFQWRILNPKAVWSAVVFGAIAAGILFPFRSATFLKNRPKITVIAAKVNALVPASETLYAVNPLFQPYLFYLHARVRYAGTVEELPADTHYFITLPSDRAHAENTDRWAPMRPKFLAATPDYRGHGTVLYHVEPQ